MATTEAKKQMLHACVPVNPKAIAINAPRCISGLVVAAQLGNDAFIPGLHRGSDPRKDLSWLGFGFNMKNKTFDVDDVMDFDVGPERRLLASKLLAAFQIVDREIDSWARLSVTVFEDLHPT